MQGIPGTAMLPKAGFPELTEAQVAGVVRFMMASVNLPPDLPAAADGARAGAKAVRAV